MSINLISNLMRLFRSSCRNTVQEDRFWVVFAATFFCLSSGMALLLALDYNKLQSSQDIHAVEVLNIGTPGSHATVEILTGIQSFEGAWESAKLDFVTKERTTLEVICPTSYIPKIFRGGYTPRGDEPVKMKIEIIIPTDAALGEVNGRLVGDVIIAQRSGVQTIEGQVMSVFEKQSRSMDEQVTIRVVSPEALWDLKRSKSQTRFNEGIVILSIFLLLTTIAIIVVFVGNSEIRRSKSSENRM